MSPGKLAAQSGHAFVEAWRWCSIHDPQRAESYARSPPGTKVVLGSPSEAKLIQLLDRAEQQGLPAALITDSGHVLLPHFTGEPIITALGVGPATRDEVDFLRRLPLVS